MDLARSPTLTSCKRCVTKCFPSSSKAMFGSMSSKGAANQASKDLRNKQRIWTHKLQQMQ